MADVRTMQKGFGGGELTPEFWGHLGDAKYQSGLATCRNFFVLPQQSLFLLFLLPMLRVLNLLYSYSVREHEKILHHSQHWHGCSRHSGHFPHRVVVM